MFPAEGWGSFGPTPPSALAGATYFAARGWPPHFYAPGYWSGEPGAALPPGVSTPGATFFAPRIWPPRHYAPRYWSGLGLSLSALARDRDIFLAIKAALDARNIFDAVLLHQPATNARAAADQNPVVTIKRTDVAEASRWGNPITLERTVKYDLTISIRDEEHEDRFERMELLESVVINALDGQAWVGVCLSDRSLISRGTDDPRARHPEQRVVMKGQFTYILTGYTNRNTID